MKETSQTTPLLQPLGKLPGLDFYLQVQFDHTLCVTGSPVKCVTNSHYCLQWFELWRGPGGWVHSPRRLSLQRDSVVGKQSKVTSPYVYEVPYMNLSHSGINAILLLLAFK